MSRTLALTIVLACSLIALAVVSSAQQPTPPTPGPVPPPSEPAPPPPPQQPAVPPKVAAGPGPWNLKGLDAHFLDGVKALQDHRFKDAEKFFKKQGKQVRKENGGKELENKERILYHLAKDLGSVQKLVKSARPNERMLLQARAMTQKYRDTFAYFLFLQLETDLRDEVATSIETFDPPLQAYKPMSEPLALFEKIKPELAVTMPPGFTDDPKDVVQGRWAAHWVDSPKNRNLGLPVYCRKVANWSEYRFLCFDARLKDPKSATLWVIVAADPQQQNYWKLGCGTWKGWKHFEFNYRSEAVVQKANARNEMSWANVSHMVFYTKGGLSDFCLDDVYLRK